MDLKFIDESSRVIASIPRDSARGPSSQTDLQKLSLHNPVSSMNVARIGQPRLNLEMHLNAFQAEIYISFLAERLFQLPSQKQALGHWIHAVSGKSHTSSPLSVSVLCLAASFYGQFHRQPIISSQGARMYSLALNQVSKLLEDANQRHSFEALACTAVLELYEVNYDIPHVLTQR